MLWVLYGLLSVEIYDHCKSCPEVRRKLKIMKIPLTALFPALLFVFATDSRIPTCIGIFGLMAILFIFCWNELGSVLMGVGGTLNGVAIALNGGKMPVSSEALNTVGLNKIPPLYCVITQHTRIAPLSDIIPIMCPKFSRLGGVCSIGDIIFVTGIIFLWIKCRKIHIDSLKN